MSNFFKKICVDFEGTKCERVPADWEFPKGTIVFDLPKLTEKIVITLKVSLKFMGVKYCSFTQHIGLK